jgi:NAD(P)H-hydrate epimerase
MKIVSVAQMRDLERRCNQAGISNATLMENAGRAVAREISRFSGGLGGKRVLVLCGPGNNGGDGLVAARALADGGAAVTAYLAGNRGEDDHNLLLLRERPATVIFATDDPESALLKNATSAADIILDAVFGTGKTRAIDDIYARVLNDTAEVAQYGRQVIAALDNPSGLDCDTGEADPACLPADYTITLGFPKHGLFNFPGAALVGELITVDIGIPPKMAEGIRSELIDEGWMRFVIPPRPLNANKGNFGRLLVIAGSSNYVGAAYLACAAAYRAGAGLVTLAAPKSLQPMLAGCLPEVTWLPLPEAEPGVHDPKAWGTLAEKANDYHAVLVGCGLGQHPATVAFLEEAIDGLAKTESDLIFDADALNIMARGPWWQRVKRDCILTPHPGEMARLATAPVPDIQRFRLDIARKMAMEWKATVCLKGANTVIAAPNGDARLNHAAVPALATAGTGDVLAGTIAGLLTQGLSLFDAASAGTYLHAGAGALVTEESGDTGLMASDLLPAIPRVIKKLRS